MRRIGRYLLLEEIAAGGMASVHLGHLVDEHGDGRTVAIKRLHPHVAASPGALEMFIDEARLGARVKHPNIVATLDVVRESNELFLVMEYVHGVQLAVLHKRARESGERIPLPITSALMLDVLAGLEAVHTTTDELGKPLAIVHRDISPQNILVADDGSARVLDFGIAKAAVRLQTTRDDQLKGKLRYMAPEQFLDDEVDGRTDEFGAGTVLWELLTNVRLFDASNDAGLIAKVLEGVIVPPSRHRADLPPEVDTLVLRALRRPKEERFPTCHEMAEALRTAIPRASRDEVRAWVERTAGDVLALGAARVARALEGNVTSGDATSDTQGTEASPTQTLRLAAPAVLTAPSAPRSRRALVIAAALGGLLVLTVALTVAAISRSPTSSPGASSPVASAVAAVENEPPSIETTPEPSAAPAVMSSSPAPASSPAAMPSTSARAGLTMRSSRPGVGGSPKPRETKPAPRAGCVPLYTVDGDGIRRVKPECL